MSSLRKLEITDACGISHRYEATGWGERLEYRQVEGQHIVEKTTWRGTERYIVPTNCNPPTRIEISEQHEASCDCSKTTK